MVQEKMSLHSSSLESVRLSFYCNSHTAILNPHQPQAKQSFAESFSGAFFQKGAVHAFCVAEKAGMLVAVHNFGGGFTGED